MTTTRSTGPDPAPGKPLLLVVSGPPGCGKTTLARLLAGRIGCPAIIRDELKQGMVLAAGEKPEQGWDALNLPVLTLFFELLTTCARAGVTVLAEAAFQDKLWRPNLEPLTELAEIRVLHCTADAAVVRERVTHRAADDPHRRAHNDIGLLTAFTVGTDPLATFVPITMGLPTLTVDTTDGYFPGLDAIIDFVVPSGRG